MELQCKLDWFAFTFPVRIGGGADDGYSKHGILSAFHSFTGGAYTGVTSQGEWPRIEKFGFYSDCVQCPITGVTISWANGNPYAMCQMSGRVCDSVTERLEIPLMMESSGGRCTRIDLAVDMECDVQPEEFVNDRSSKRIKTSGSFISESGSTCYVGSRTGERMARVYRYKEPHPRSRLLRAEVEYKGDAAKKLALELTSSPLREVTLSAHAPFGWSHPIWDTGEAVISKIPARDYDKSNDGTWLWLMGTAWPALCKAHDKGKIDLVKVVSEWLEGYKPK